MEAIGWKFKEYRQDWTFLLPPSLDEFVPEDHEVRIINEVVDTLDLSTLLSRHEGGGAPAYHPAMMLKVIIYAYSLGIYSSRRITQELKTDTAFMLPKKEGRNPVEQRAIENFEKIAKEGRKYGVALLVISQRPSDVSTTILSQCNNIIALRLTNSEDQMTVKKLMPESLEGLMDTLPILDIGEALVVGDAVLLPSRIRIDPPAEKPLSVTVDFWTDWSKEPDEPDFIKAIENMRRQNRE